MLQATGLRKSYGGVLAVGGLGFTAAPGQTIGLLGPNGSGKSTTINMLTGLIRPSSGSVTWNGASIHDQLVAYQALLGYVPEEPRLYAYLSAPEYLRLVGGLRDIDGRRARPPHRPLSRALRPRERPLRAAVVVLEGDAAEGADRGGAAPRSRRSSSSTSRARASTSPRR